MTKVLVTGGLGFQGTHLTKRLLDEGHEVYVINAPAVDAQANLQWLMDKTTLAFSHLHVVWTSITDKACLERLVPQCPVIFHLAAKINVDESIETPDVFYETNIQGTYNILNLAVKHKARVILASTCEVYGGGEDLSENSLLNPRSPYAASKAAAERIAYCYAQTYGLIVDIVRPFNVYGPLQKDGGHGAVIGIFTRKIMNDDEISIHGDGTQGRDFIYIEDVIEGYMDIFRSSIIDREDKCRIYTFGTGISTSVNTLVSLIEKYLGKEADKKYVEGRKGQVTTFIAKNNLNTYFKDKKVTSFEEGLKKYLDFKLKGAK